LLCESATSRYSRRKISTDHELSGLGGTVLPGSPAAFGKLITEDTAKWAKVVKFAGIKAD
jgi:hypothetical protein